MTFGIWLIATFILLGKKCVWLSSDWAFDWHPRYVCSGVSQLIGQVVSCLYHTSYSKQAIPRKLGKTDTYSAIGQTQKRVKKKKNTTHSKPLASHVLVFQPRDGWCCELFPFFWIEQRPAMIQIQKLNFGFSQSDVLRLTVWSACCDCCFWWVSVPQSDQSWEAIKKDFNTFPDVGWTCSNNWCWVWSCCYLAKRWNA